MSKYRVSKMFLVCMVLICGSPLLVKSIDVDARIVSSVLGFIAFCVLAWQWVAHLDVTPAAVRVATVLILASLLLGAIAQGQLAGEVRYTYATYPFIGHRVACLLFAIYYRRLIGLNMLSPAVKQRTT